MRGRANDPVVARAKAEATGPAPTVPAWRILDSVRRERDAAWLEMFKAGA